MTGPEQDEDYPPLPPPGPTFRPLHALADPAAPPPEDRPEPEAVAAGFYGATQVARPPGAFRPVPVVTINGVDVATGTLAGDVPWPVVLDGFSVTWGREDILDQMEPATGRLQIFDPTRTWAFTQGLIGHEVVLSWVGDVEAAEGGSLGMRRAFFRGRVSGDVQIGTKTVVVNGRKVTGALITLPLVSMLNGLANRVPTVDWPQETLAARRARILAVASPEVTSLVTRSYWDNAAVAAFKAANQRSLWAHITALYDSCGADRMMWDPETRAMSYLDRRAIGATGLGQLRRDEPALSARVGRGAFIASVRPNQNSPGLPPFSISIDGRTLEGESTVVRRGPGQLLTRVVARNPEDSLQGATRTNILFVGPDENVLGVRAVNLDSDIVWGAAWVDVAAGDLVKVASQEGAKWQMSDVQLRAVGGFTDSRVGRVLLAGHESSTYVFITGSEASRLYERRPAQAVIGGTIGYRDGAWECSARLRPIYTSVNQHAISWEEIDDHSPTFTTVWSDTPDHPSGLHSSVTWEDMRWVCKGLNLATYPTNQNWDTPPI